MKHTVQISTQKLIREMDSSELIDFVSQYGTNNKLDKKLIELCVKCYFQLTQRDLNEDAKITV
jgi:hypothetical protein